MKSVLAMAVMGAMALAAAPAATEAAFYARGEFNGWGTTGASGEMTDMGGGHFQVTMTGLTPGQIYQWKVAEDTETQQWVASWPSNNSRITADAGGNLTFHLWTSPGADGWSPDPTGGRAGVSDTGYGWEVMGSFNGWTTPVSMTDLGGSHFRATMALTAGDYEYKFRTPGNWDSSLGKDFGFGDNAAVSIPADGVYAFDLDLAGGRYLVSAVPEPASVGVAGLGLLGLATRRKRR